MENLSTVEVRESTGIKRRNVVTAAAWAVPVVAAAAAAPIAAASGEPSENPTSSSVTLQSNIATGAWAKAEIRAIDASVRPEVPAVFPEDSVITIQAPEGGVITIDANDRVGIGSISGEGTGTVVITPLTGSSTVTCYVSTNVAGTVTVALTGTLSNSGSGVFK